jgi:uncharacterized membrane protein YraQ (UPF0718 family)
MSTTSLLINGLAIIGLLLSLLKGRQKTVRALKIAGKSLIKLGPAMGMVILLIGVLLGFLPKQVIAGIVGSGSGFGGILLAALFGAVLYMPSLVAFPLAGSLLSDGASVAAVGALITTLTMVSTVTLPLEIKILGRKLALLRNGLSFAVALCIALLMGMILS